ncbi:hypothetical protein ACVL5V_003067 [Bradyrhizobium ottawaense]
MRLQFVPLRIGDRQVQDRVDGSLLHGRQRPSGIIRPGLIPCGRLEDRQQQSLEGAVRRALEIRTALGIDQPPAAGAKVLRELVRKPRLSDAGVTHEQNGLAAGADPFGRTPQQGPLRRAVDKSGNTARTPDPPARKIARAHDPVHRHRLAETAERLAAQEFEADVSIRELLTGLRDVDLVRLGRRFQPRGQMLGRPADLIDLGEFAGDHVGDHMARVEPDPDLKTGIAQAANTPDELDGRVASERRVVVVGDRGTEHGGQPVSQLLADNATELAHRSSHRRESRLEARHRGLRLQLGDKSCGIDDVGAQNGHEPPFAVGLNALADRRSAFGAPAIARTDRRLTREAMHSSAFKRLPQQSSLPAPARHSAYITNRGLHGN